MGMVIRTNVMALNSNNALNKANGTIAGSMEKLSTGFRINKAADDASGLSISEKMKAQIKALDTAVDNCEDGANMIQTAEGYMAETQDMLNRMVELSEKAANGVLDETDRDALQDEMDQLCAEIDRIATTANFNGKKLMDGSIGSNGAVQVTSTAEGNGYYVADTLVVQNGTYAGTGTLTVTGSEIANMSKAEQDDISAAAVKMATDAVKGTGTAAATTTQSVWVKADGTDITLENKATDAFAADTNKNGYIKMNVTVAYTASNDANEKYTAGAVTLDANGAAKGMNDTDKAQLKADIEALAENKAAADGGLADNASKPITVYYNSKGEVTLDDKSKDAYSATNVNGWTAQTVNVTYTAEKNSNATDNHGIKLQIGESSTAADKVEVKIGSFHTDTLLSGIDGFKNYTASTTGETDDVAVAQTKANANATYKDGISVDITSSQDAASAAADALRQVSNYVSDQRGRMGALQNRLEHTVNNLTTASENTSAANSRIRDTDMAKEMIKYTSTNVITQAAQAMLAQANTQPQNVLQLLQ